MKKILAYILIIVSFGDAFSSVVDTIPLDSVSLNSASFKEVNNMDSLVARNPFTSISELLTNESVVQVNNEGGKGTTKSLSIRGLTSNHTNVRWNGLNVNSLALGMYNFGGIPCGVANELELIKGNAISDINDVAIGGVVILSNKLNWDKPLSFSAGGEIGSFGFNAHKLNFSKSTSQWSFNVNWIFQEALNNFSYINHKKIGAPRETQEHANFSNKNVVFSTGWRSKSKNIIITNHTWIGERKIKTPKTYTDGLPSHAYSNDSTIKSITSVKTTIGKVYLKASAGINHERYLYHDSTYDISTYYILNNAHLNLKAKYQFNQWQFSFLNESQFQKALNNQYVGIKKRNLMLSKLNASRELKASKLKLFSTIAFNKVFSSKLSVPVVSIGYTKQIKKTEIKGGVGNHFRIASFNDSFWPQGGNESLEPELGWNAEQSFKTQLKYKKLHWSIFTEAYYSIIDNWIQWKPNGSFWSAQNVKQVNARGAEFKSVLYYTLGKMKLGLQNQYAYTQTITMSSNSSIDFQSIGKQVIYVPLHKSLNKLFIVFKGFNLSYSLNYFGLRHTTSDNMFSKALAPYLLNDFEIFKKIDFKRKSMFIKSSILNLFNNSYEGLGNRPMPGRAFYLTLVFKFT